MLLRYIFGANRNTRPKQKLLEAQSKLSSIHGEINGDDILEPKSEKTIHVRVGAITENIHNGVHIKCDIGLLLCVLRCSEKCCSVCYSGKS